MRSETSSKLYESYSGAVAYIAVRTKEGDEGIGSSFHIGEGVFVTARHIIEGNIISEIGITDRGLSTELNIKSGPFFHPNNDIDIAVIIVHETNIPVVPLGTHLDDWLGDELVLSEVLVMGYPPVPFSRDPLLIASKSEINAVLDKYTGGHPHFIVSTLARGGFSGGLALSEYGFALGVITESLVYNGLPSELGYLAVISIEPILVCLSNNKIMPNCVREQWLNEGENTSIWDI